MAGSSPASTVRAFVEPIQAALSCFATGKVTVDTFRPDVEGVLVLSGGLSVRLHGPDRIELSVTMRYVVRPSADGASDPRKVTTTGWIDELLDHRGSSLAAHHWHPISSSHVTTPHLHVPGEAKRHFPTGRVLIEDILTLAMELGAAPTDPGKWRAREAANRAAFRDDATWGHQSPQDVPPN